jgi:hypothetical protein
MRRRANAGWLSALYGCTRIISAILDCLGPLFDDLLSRTTLGFKILPVPNPTGEGREFCWGTLERCCFSNLCC